MATQKPEDARKTGWMYRYKRTIILSTFLVLAAVLAVTMAFIGMTLRDRLIRNSKAETEEVAEIIELSLRHLMIARNPGKIQQSLEAISGGGGSVTNAFILDNRGKVVYSSRTADIGRILDRKTDPSCNGCHGTGAALSNGTTTIVSAAGGAYLRTVNIIFNGGACISCHIRSDRTVGKLIIDRSMAPTEQLIAAVEYILAGSGVLCLVVLAPFLSRILSRGVDAYITEILFKSTELAMLYKIVERLSKTIELEDLKRIILDIVRELFHADEVHLILPGSGKEYGGVVCKGDESKIDRRIPPADDPYRELICAWAQGTLAQEQLIEDGRGVVLLLAKGGVRQGMIIAKRSDRRFDGHDLEMIRAMGSHIAVALENAALYRIAITDELTGLYSKRHFRSVIEKKFDLYEQYGEKLALLMLDIDNFKQVNDTYGHPAGDIILREVAARVMKTTREGDLDFRYGGEEITILLPSTDGAGAVSVAERVREQIGGAAYDIGERKLRITVSIGAAAIPEHAATIRDLVNEADKALYEAKRSGKNRVVLSRSATG